MDDSSSNGNFLEQLSAVWRRRWGVILGVFAVVAVPSVCAVIALPDVYDAEATVIPVGNSLKGTSHMDTAATSLLDSVTEQVLSRERLTALIKKYDLYPDAKHGPQSMTSAMRKNILIQPQSVQQGRDTLPYAFNVIYRGGDPKKAAAITNSLAAAYETVAHNMQTQAFSNAADTLRSRLDLLRNKLAKQQDLINRYQNEHRGELPDQQSANLATMQRLDSQLRNNDAKQLRLMESRADLLEKKRESSQSTLEQMEQRLADLKLQYTDKYPEVVTLKERIANLKAHRPNVKGNSEVRTSLDVELSRVDTELAALQQEEKRLRAKINTYQSYLDDAPVTGQRLKSLTQGYTETSDLYATLLKSYEEARIAYATSAEGGLQFQVLEAAMVPTETSGPGRLRLLLICLVLGLGLAGLATVLTEQFDTSFHSLEELQAFTSLPVLSTVPLILTPRDVRKKRLRSGAAVLSVLSLVVALGAGASIYTHENHVLAQRFSQNIGSDNE